MFWLMKEQTLNFFCTVYFKAVVIHSHFEFNLNPYCYDLVSFFYTIISAENPT